MTAPLYHTIIGLPGSGKTTFLAAFWHLIDAGEVATKLVIDKLVGDHRHLNQIADCWRSCREVPRTSQAAEEHVTLFARDPATGKKFVLAFPDLSGESFENQFSLRHCTESYIAGLNSDGGVMLFINADRPSDGISLLDMIGIFEDANVGEAGAQNAGDVDAQNTSRDWDAEMSPQQVQIVDILQIILQVSRKQKRRKLAVIVSAWDVVFEPRPTPDEWLRREMPLVHQFLQCNQEHFESRVYGVSAQGGDVTGDQRETLLETPPSERVQCVGPAESGHDMTSPIAWLNDE